MPRKFLAIRYVLVSMRACVYMHTVFMCVSFTCAHAGGIKSCDYFIFLDSSKSTDGACTCIDDGEEEDFDWSIEQKLPEEEATNKISLNNSVRYGFANQYCGILAKLQVMIIII